MRSAILIGFFLLLQSSVWAAIDAFEFDTSAQEQQYRHLIAELRCPKCQNQNIADSNAPLATDLRQKVYQMVQSGRSDYEITDYMVQRYGDFVTYRPPVKPLTWVLWFGPLAIVAIAAMVLLVWIRQRNRNVVPDTLSEQENARLDAILGNDRHANNSEKSS